MPVRFHWPLGVMMEEINVAAQIKVYVEGLSAFDSVKAEIGKIAKVQRYLPEGLTEKEETR